MKIVNVTQRSPEWYEIRRGLPTASAFDKLVTRDGTPSKQSTGYLYELVAERLAGVNGNPHVSPAMEEGIRREAESRAVYAMLKEVDVEEVGFVLHDSGRYGCSPDGLVGDDGLVELKNPTGKVAVEYLVKQNLDAKYWQQVQGQLLVTGREWVDIMSYYPGLPPLIIRVERDEGFLAKLEAELGKFCDGLDAICREIGERYESHG